MLDVVISLGFPFSLFFPTEPPIQREEKLTKDKKLESRDECKAYMRNMDRRNERLGILYTRLAVRITPYKRLSGRPCILVTSIANSSLDGMGKNQYKFIIYLNSRNSIRGGEQHGGRKMKTSIMIRIRTMIVMMVRRMVTDLSDEAYS